MEKKMIIIWTVENDTPDKTIHSTREVIGDKELESYELEHCLDEARQLIKKR